MESKKENLFLTKHVLSIASVFYISTASPFITKAIETGATRQDWLQFINVSLVALFAAGTKAYDKNVYTPKYLPGRDKDNALAAVYAEPTVVEQITHIAQNPVATVVAQVTDDPVAKQVANVVDTVSNPVGILGKSSGESSAQEQNTTGLYIKALQKTWLKMRPIDSTELGTHEKIELQPNETTSIISYKEPINKHIEILAGKRVWFIFAEHAEIYRDGEPVSFSTVFMPTQQQLSTIYGNTVTDALYSDFKTCLATFDIFTPADISHFIAQTGHESGGLIYTKEIASGEDYEGREDLGNTQAGDGRLFRGAGFIQLTGRANYISFAQDTNDPEIVKQGCTYVATKYPFTSAGWFWYKNTLSDYINNEGADIYMVTRVVNGGLNGIDDRIAYYTKAREVLGLA